MGLLVEAYSLFTPDFAAIGITDVPGRAHVAAKQAGYNAVTDNFLRRYNFATKAEGLEAMEIMEVLGISAKWMHLCSEHERPARPGWIMPLHCRVETPAGEREMLMCCHNNETPQPPNLTLFGYPEQFAGWRVRLVNGNLPPLRLVIAPPQSPTLGRMSAAAMVERIRGNLAAPIQINRHGG